MLTFLRFTLGFMLVLTSLFLILLVLIQRGRGGGLTGALGGAGGQSAFGTKAGDVFTRITVGVAAFWIGLCILALNVLGQSQSLFSPTLGGNAGAVVAPQPTAPPAAGAPAAKPATEEMDIQLEPKVPAADGTPDGAGPDPEPKPEPSPAPDVDPDAATK